MLRVLYYAYGSNIDIERLRNRVETISERIVPGVRYILENYRLVFNAGMKYGSIAFANIVPSMGDRVEGILYSLSPEQFSVLDRYEMLYEKQYFRIDRDTIGIAYVSKRDNIASNRAKPSLDYLNIIIDGCEQSGLINTYNQLIQYKLNNYKLKKSKHKLR